MYHFGAALTARHETDDEPEEGLFDGPPTKQLGGFDAAHDTGLFPDSTEEPLFGEEGEAGAENLDLFGIPKTEKPAAEAAAAAPDAAEAVGEAKPEVDSSTAGQGSGDAKPSERPPPSPQREEPAPQRVSPSRGGRQPTGLVRERFEKRVREFKAVIDTAKIDLDRLRNLSQTGTHRPTAHGASGRKGPLTWCPAAGIPETDGLRPTYWKVGLLCAAATH